ncbi:MAG: hypothetical protein HOY78_23505 [Saccharothrix sp.]|nr:hypothetical protein [Saccharothrix sp.]
MSAILAAYLATRLVACIATTGAAAPPVTSNSNPQTTNLPTASAIRSRTNSRTAATISPTTVTTAPTPLHTLAAPRNAPTTSAARARYASPAAPSQPAVRSREVVSNTERLKPDTDDSQARLDPITVVDPVQCGLTRLEQSDTGNGGGVVLRFGDERVVHRVPSRPNRSALSLSACSYTSAVAFNDSDIDSNASAA